MMLERRSGALGAVALAKVLQAGAGELNMLFVPDMTEALEVLNGFECSFLSSCALIRPVLLLREFSLLAHLGLNATLDGPLLEGKRRPEDGWIGVDGLSTFAFMLLPMYSSRTSGGFSSVMIRKWSCSSDSNEHAAMMSRQIDSAKGFSCLGSVGWISVRRASANVPNAKLG